MPNQGGLQLLPETRKSISVTVPGENRVLYIGIVILIVSILTGVKISTFLPKSFFRKKDRSIYASRSPLKSLPK